MLHSAWAQTSLTQSTITSTSSISSIDGASGQIINAVNGSPIYRALVQTGASAQLTDHDGRFRLPVTQQGSITLQISKPGFYGSVDGNLILTINRTSRAQEALVVRLYPEALLTGTVKDMKGQPLPQVTVALQRSIYSETGHQWIPAGAQQTNSRGEFRLVGPSGDYRVEARRSARDADGKSYIPSIYPSQTSSETQRYIHVAPAEEGHADLLLESNQVYAIPVRFEPMVEDSFSSITAVSSTGAHIPINLASGRSRTPATIELPPGSYLLRAVRNHGDQQEYAEASLRVDGSESPEPLVFRFSTLASIPITVRLDSGVTSDNAPTAQQLGVMLSPSSDTISESTIRPIARRDGSISFSPLPGSYRLLSLAHSSWYIRSAMSGNIDLLREDISVVAGASNSPILLMISNQTASISGAVTAGGSAQAGWVYLIPTTASATPFFTVRSSPEGAYRLNSIPPGSYRVVAFEQRQQVDMRSSEELAPYSHYVQSITLAAGERKSLDLEQVSPRDLQP